MTVYFFRVGRHGPIKIGKTAGTVNMRLNNIRCSMPFPVNVMGVIEDQKGDLETALHARFRHLRIRGEWFKASPELLRFIEAESGSPEQALSSHLTERQVERLRGVADRTGLTVAELIRRAVDALLAKQDKEKNDGRAQS